MRQLNKLFVAIALCASLTAAAQDIEINAGNFPDENFRNYLLAQDYGKDGVLTETEIEQITEISVFSKRISSLQGIEHFTALEDLDCTNNQLTALDVSKNTALKSMSCAHNQLTTLNVSGCTALSGKLRFYGNQIKGEAMDAFISGLPENTSGELYVCVSIYDSSKEGNVITKSQIAAAKAKGWTSYDSTRHEYEGVDDKATSIGLPEVENGDATVYNLAGKKAERSAKGGIYVVDGKKVVVK